MADEFEFELDVDAATEAEAAVVATLRSQLSGADDELAQAFVNKMYQQFFDALPSTAKKTCKDTDLRPQWLRDWYWKTLQDYVAVVKDAYVPHIDMTAFSADERQQMENLHRKLSKQDAQAVLQLFTAEYDKYFNGLDTSVHEACDEQMSQRLQRSWISKNYVATMEQYVAKEKDKFEFDKELEAMTPELQEVAKTLLPCLRNSEADNVVRFLNEEWENYFENSCDAVMLRSCKLPDLQHQWKMQYYVPCLLKYVAKRDHHVTDPVSKPLQPYKSGDFSSPVHSKRLLSPASSASGSPAKRRRGDHTELHNLKGSMAVTHSVLAKVLVAMSSVATIDIKGDIVQRYSYVLGSKSANVECSLLGREATSVAALMSPLVGKVIQLSHADWDARRGMLKHMPSTLVKPLEEEHDLHDADFIYVPFDAIPSMTPWSRVSIEGFLNTVEEPTASPKDANKWIRQISMSDPHQRGVKVILISRDKDATKFLDEQSDMHVQVNYAKVNATSCTVYADLDDMTNIVQSGKDSVARPDPSVVKEIDWNRR